ncbi:MAG: hypothetical protein QOJ94_2440, partial [Sphingomonadales bacterium]|nr:hypothetical protein [Sphingomonadales bacterium]
MKFEYEWQELPKVGFDVARMTANSQIKIWSDQGENILTEEFVPLIDLAESFLSWDNRSSYVFEADG